MPEPQPAPADQLRALLPPEGYRQLVATLEEYSRRAKLGKRVPETMLIGLILSRQTGEVVEVEVPRRFGR